MSALLWAVIGGLAGAVGGIVLGFASALAWASALPNPGDGTFALRQMVVCVPLGALAGLVAGIVWGAGRP